MKRNSALRRKLRLKMGSRATRRRSTKVLTGSRTWGPTGHIRKRQTKPSVLLDRKEQEVTRNG